MANDIKIVADSSADFYKLEGVSFASAPLKIVNDDKEYVDDENLDVSKMVAELLGYQGKVSTACPGPGDWLEAFGDAKYIIGVAISSKLSGSFNSMRTAKDVYESEHPDRHVFCVDSCNAGPGMQLIVYKLRELINAGKSFEEICKEIEEYKHHVGIVFMLASVHNFANNGRVSKLVEKAIKVLNIKVIGRGSLEGELQIVGKVHGNKKGIPAMFNHYEKEGMEGKKVVIGHVYNQPLAEHMATLIKEKYPNADIMDIYQLHGLCSFYAEKDGLLVAFERDPSEVDKDKEGLLSRLKNND